MYNMYMYMVYDKGNGICTLCICTWSMIIKGNGKCTICICTWSMIKVMVYVHYVYVHGL